MAALVSRTASASGTLSLGIGLVLAGGWGALRARVVTSRWRVGSMVWHMPTWSSPIGSTSSSTAVVEVKLAVPAVVGVKRKSARVSAVAPCQ